MITLVFCATGNDYKSLEFSSRVSRYTILKFTLEVVSAIYKQYQDELFMIPSTPAELRNIALNFST